MENEAKYSTPQVDNTKQWTLQRKKKSNEWNICMERQKTD